MHMKIYTFGLVIGSISAALSSPVPDPPREEIGGKNAGSFSRTAAGNQA